MEKVDKEQITTIAMQVILHAGNARDYIFKSISNASSRNFANTDELVKKAEEEVAIAHKEQTSTLQKEAEGIEIPYSPLFVHAQDTLMTVKSEINIIKELIKVYKTMEV